LTGLFRSYKFSPTDRLVHGLEMTSTREQILDAASRLVHVRGFNNTSVDDILKDADVVAGVVEELKGHLAQYRVA